MSRQQFIYSLFFVFLLSLSFASCQLSDGEKNFREAGFPTIFIIGGTIIILVSLGASGGVGGLSAGFVSLLNHKLLFVLNTLLFVFGIFLLFGPGAADRTNILGFQLMVFAAIAYYSALSHSKSAKYILLGFGTFTWLGLIGALQFLNYSTAVYDIQQSDCLTYFTGATTDTGYDRCNDTGILQLIRTTGSASILLLLVVLAVVLLDDAAFDSAGAGKKSAEANPNDPLVQNEHHSDTSSYQSAPEQKA